MGCFGQSCLITRLPIHEGDRCYALPLMRNRFFGDLNSSFAAFWKPLFLPIEGGYNDYGDLTDIKADENTTFLERFYEAPIETIAATITCSRKQGERDIEYTQYGALMSRFGPKLKRYELMPANLAKMGFKVTKGLVTHPRVEYAEAILVAHPEQCPKGAMANQLFRLVKRPGDYPPYVIEVTIGGKAQERPLDDIGSLCVETTRYLNTLSHADPYANHRRYMFGVGEFGNDADRIKRDRLWLLQDSTRVFMLKEAYDEFAAQGLGQVKGSQYDSPRLTEALADLDEAVKKVEALKGRESKDIEFERLLHGMSTRTALEHGVLAAFHEPRDTYGTDLPYLAAKLRAHTEAFYGFTHAAIVNNIMLYPNQSFQQHGSPEDQAPYHALIARLCEADIKAYKAWAHS